MGSSGLQKKLSVAGKQEFEFKERNYRMTLKKLFQTEFGVI